MSRYHSPSPEVVAVKSNSLPKKNSSNLLSNVSSSMSNVSVNVSSSSRNSASSVSQRTNDNVEVKPNRVCRCFLSDVYSLVNVIRNEKVY